MKIVSIIFVVLFAYHSAIPQCEISVGKGESAADWDQTFTQNGPGKGLEPLGSPGWTGADSTISIEWKYGILFF